MDNAWSRKSPHGAVDRLALRCLAKDPAYGNKLQANYMYTVRIFAKFFSLSWILLKSTKSKGVDLTGLLGGHKRRLVVWGQKSPSGVQRRSLGRGPGGRSPPPPEAEAFL